MKEDLLKKIIKAKKVVAKVDSDISLTYVEGICSPHQDWNGEYDDVAGTVGFRKFLNMIQTLKKAE